ncbi:MAG: ComEC/Rec2 family competence protein [Armatimonadota bacterium]
MLISRRPLFLFTLAYIAGIVCALRESAVWVVLPALAFSLRRRVPVLLILLMCAVFVLGFGRSLILSSPPAGDVSGLAEGKLVYLTGRVDSDPEVRGEWLAFFVRAERVRTYASDRSVSGRVRVSIYLEPGRVPFYGERVRLHGRLEKPRDGKSAEYLARHGAFASISGNRSELSVLGPPRWSLTWVASKFRGTVTAAAHRFLPPVYAELLLGLLLGSYASLPLDLQAAFARTGTLHLLAASGYNCGLVAGMFGYLMSRLTAPRVTRHVLLIGAVWMFALVAGPGPSIIRAAVMATAFLAAYMLMRAPDMLNIILFACLVILGSNPLNLFDVGFQLSFAAVFAIVLAMPIVEPALHSWLVPKDVKRCRMVFRAIIQSGYATVIALVVSLVVTSATWPITALYFNYFSIVSVVANALTALLVAGLTAGGISMLLSGSVWMSLGKIVSVPVIVFASLMVGIVGGLSDLPWAVVSVRSPSALFMGAYYIAFLGVLDYANRKAARK